MSNLRICIYCGSSRQCDPAYLRAAARLGRELARHGATIVYGGGAVGSMGALADSALAEGGKVVGIIPGFMNQLEWGHKGITELRIVSDMHERKRLMLQDAHAVVALPGGSGTFDELLEAISLKRLAVSSDPSFFSTPSRISIICFWRSSAASPSASWTPATNPCGRS